MGGLHSIGPKFRRKIVTGGDVPYFKEEESENEMVRAERIAQSVKCLYTA